jgi:hypothetical protein
MKQKYIKCDLKFLFTPFYTYFIVYVSDAASTCIKIHIHEYKYIYVCTYIHINTHLYIGINKHKHTFIYRNK